MAASGIGDDFGKAIAARRSRRQSSHDERVKRRSVAHQAQPGVKIVGLAQGARARQAKFRGEHRRIDRADAKRDDGAGIAEHGVLKVFGKLGDVLIRRDQGQSPLARFRQDRSEAVGGEVLEFVDIEGEVAALVFGDVAPRFGGLRDGGDQKRAQEMRGLGAEIAFREIDDENSCPGSSCLAMSMVEAF